MSRIALDLKTESRAQRAAEAMRRNGANAFVDGSKVIAATEAWEFFAVQQFTLIDVQQRLIERHEQSTKEQSSADGAASRVGSHS